MSRYDDPRFFSNYEAMRCRTDNFNDHVVDRAFWELAGGDFHGKRALDLGCGWGAYDKRMADLGARVVAVDPSEKMLLRARRENAHPAVQYMQSMMEDCRFEPATFDLAVSCLAMHYIQDWPALLKNIHTWLKPGGALAFLVEHPVNTASRDNGWEKDAQGKRRHWKLDDYFDEGARTADWLGASVQKYHRTAATLVTSVISAGFLIEKLIEPHPVPGAIRQYPELAKGVRYPMFLGLRARKS